MNQPEDTAAQAAPWRPRPWLVHGVLALAALGLFWQGRSSGWILAEGMGSSLGLVAVRLATLSLLLEVSRRLLPLRWALLPVLALLIAPASPEQGQGLLASLAPAWLGMRYLQRRGRWRGLQLLVVGAWAAWEIATVPLLTAALEPWFVWLSAAVYGTLAVRLLLYLPVILHPDGSGNAFARKSRWLVLCLAAITGTGPLLYLCWTVVWADVALARPSNSPGLPPAALASRARLAAILHALALLLPVALLAAGWAGS
jgi:hypothetical protein